MFITLLLIPFINFKLSMMLYIFYLINIDKKSTAVDIIAVTNVILIHGLLEYFIVSFYSRIGLILIITKPKLYTNIDAKLKSMISIYKLSIDNILNWFMLGVEKEVKYLRTILNTQLLYKMCTGVTNLYTKSRDKILDMNISQPWKYKTVVT